MATKGSEVELERASPSAAPAMGGVSEELVAAAAAEIRELHRTSAMSEAASIGRIILDRFYGSDAAMWRSHHPEKSVSLRKLSRELGGIFTLSTLRRCVRIRLVSHEHPRLAGSKHLTASHADELYGLAFDDIEELLGKAENEQWNVLALRRARQELVLLRAAKPGVRSPGRPVSPPEFKAITRLANAASIAEDAWSLLENVSDPHPEARLRLFESARALRVAVKRIVERLGQGNATASQAPRRVPQRQSETHELEGERGTAPARRAS
jgi:hypothetical protein